MSFRQGHILALTAVANVAVTTENENGSIRVDLANSVEYGRP